MIRTASLRWQHQPIVRPPCRSERRRFRGNLNLNHRFIRPHSPGIDFAPTDRLSTPLHPPFLPFSPFGLLLTSYSRLSDLRLYSLSSLIPVAVYYCHAIFAMQCPRKYRMSGRIGWHSLRMSRKHYQTPKLIRLDDRTKGPSGKGQETIRNGTLEDERSTKSLARVHSDGIAGAICSRRNRVI